MIKVLMTWQDLSEGDRFMFEKLFDQDLRDHARAFVLASNYDAMFQFSGLVNDIEIRYNKDDFGIEDAPEFYGVICW